MAEEPSTEPKQSGRLARWREQLDAWFGTVARWLGFLLVAYELGVDHLRNPAILTAGVGLIAVRNLVDKKGG